MHCSEFEHSDGLDVLNSELGRITASAPTGMSTLHFSSTTMLLNEYRASFPVSLKYRMLPGSRLCTIVRGERETPCTTAFATELVLTTQYERPLEILITSRAQAGRYQRVQAFRSITQSLCESAVCSTVGIKRKVALVARYRSFASLELVHCPAVCSRYHSCS